MSGPARATVGLSQLVGARAATIIFNESPVRHGIGAERSHGCHPADA
jgi:hypothetical protein